VAGARSLSVAVTLVFMAFLSVVNIAAATGADVMVLRPIIAVGGKAVTCTVPLACIVHRIV